MKNLDQVSIVGVGLLGGSIGLALQAIGFTGRRVGVGRRASSLRKAMEAEAVDEVTRDMAKGVAHADLVVLCSPIGRFESLLTAMAPHLKPGAIVTDVGSTKVEVVRIAQRILPKHVKFVGSHPIAGSEKTGVAFARADLFDRALCLITPTKNTDKTATRTVRKLWQELGGQTLTISPADHDRLLARVSHLPHVVATALVHLSLKNDAIDLAGPGFADTTRIASGDPNMWTDILGTNRKAMIESIDLLIAELTRLRNRLDRDQIQAICDWLGAGKQARDRWINRRYRKKVLPP
jgi:prephenate dehydrogenase